MNKVEYNSIINAIKSNDLVLFSKFIKNNENTSFGRFPILTLLYLYNAKKIIKVYKDELLKVKFFNIIDEPLEFYNKFKSIAGRSLRLYLNDTIVSPIEILAILNRDSEVKGMFKYYIEHKLINEKVSKNLTKIYTINKQISKQNKNKIYISPKRFSKKEKLWYRIGLATSFTFILAVCSVLMFLNSTIGFGTSTNPYKIYNVTQLISALKTDGYYSLYKDLTITEELKDIDFNGHIEGNNHTLNIDYFPNKSLINENNGDIKNLNITYANHNGNVYENLSLFTATNNGNIDNVNISLNALNLTCNKSSNDMYINGYANTNNGTIANCNLTLNLTINSTGNGECFVSGFAGINSGTIEKCNYLAGSISTNDADASGFTITNELLGKIKDSKNHANISQTSALDSWSPNVSGFSMSNYGTIDGCVNFGTMTATSTNDTDNAQGSVLIGGITSNNYGLIQKSLNKGTINASVKKIIIYAGGISGFTDYWTNNGTVIYPAIINCGTQGNINTTSEDEKSFVLAGGISGFLYGEIIDCYSLSTLTTAHDDERTFIGSLLGSAIVGADYWGREYIAITSQNNYVIQNENTPNHIGALLYRYEDLTGNHTSIVYVGEDASGVTVTNDSTIMQKEVYFDEQA